MFTVVVPSSERPETLPTALRSIARQTARAAVAAVVIERSADEASAAGAIDDLPVHFAGGGAARDALTQRAALLKKAQSFQQPYIAILHEDAWWGPDHLANALGELQRNAETRAYWTTAFCVHGERSWVAMCWSISCWVASGFKPLGEVVTFDAERSALAAYASAPLHQSGVVAQADALIDAFSASARWPTLVDNDRLLFLELARGGAQRIRLVPEIFVRHVAKDRWFFSPEGTADDVRIATQAALDFCREHGVDAVCALERLADECPFPAWRNCLHEIIDPAALEFLRARNALPFYKPYTEPRNAKWLARQACPPLLWGLAQSLRENMRGTRGSIPRA